MKIGVGIEKGTGARGGWGSSLPSSCFPVGALLAGSVREKREGSLNRRGVPAVLLMHRGPTGGSLEFCYETRTPPPVSGTTAFES
jgi:hypothetical protein